MPRTSRVIVQTAPRRLELRELPLPDVADDTFGVTSPSYRAAIRTIEAGRIPVARMHTHDVALEDAEHAMRLLAGEIPGEQSIHSCLVPSLSRS